MRRGRDGPVHVRGWAALWRLGPATAVVKPSKYLTGLVGRKNRLRRQVIRGKRNFTTPTPRAGSRRGTEKAFRCERPVRPAPAHVRARSFYDSVLVAGLLSGSVA